MKKMKNGQILFLIYQKLASSSSTTNEFAIYLCVYSLLFAVIASKFPIVEQFIFEC